MRGQLRLSASLYETTSSRKAVQQVVVDGSDDEIFNLVDQMTTQIITEQFGKPSQQLESIGAATTQSIPALKAYLGAIQADREGLLEKEYDLLKEAVQADSTFAMAWLELSLYCWGWTANMDEARFAMIKAKKYGTKLNERYHYNIDGLNHFINGENLMAYDVYRELLQKYPDDINGYIVLCPNLFVANYLYGRSIFESVDYFKKWIALDPENGTAYQGILPLILQGKNLNEIDAVIAKINEVSPSHELAWQYTTPRAFIAGDQAGLKQALIEAKSKRDFEVRFMAWQICVVAPESDAADPFIQILTQPNQPLATRLCGYHTLAFMHSGKGKIHQAMTELDTAAALQPAAGLIFRAFICSLPFFRIPREELEKLQIALEQWPAEKEKNIQASELIQSMPVNIYPQTRLYLLGLVHSALGQFDQVEKYAIALKRMTTPYDEASIVEQWAITLQVLAAMSRGEDDQALALLQSSDVRIRFSLFNYNFYSFAYQRYLRGVLLCRLNRPQEALPWFLCVFQMIDSPVTAQARLRCAEACEKLGRNEEAKKYYREFIVIWKNSDPELQPEVAKAQERLSKIP